MFTGLGGMFHVACMYTELMDRAYPELSSPLRDSTRREGPFITVMLRKPVKYILKENGVLGRNSTHLDLTTHYLCVCRSLQYSGGELVSLMGAFWSDDG
jgi:hypothetical protein